MKLKLLRVMFRFICIFINSSFFKYPLPIYTEGHIYGYYSHYKKFIKETKETSCVKYVYFNVTYYVVDLHKTHTIFQRFECSHLRNDLHKKNRLYLNADNFFTF